MLLIVPPDRGRTALGSLERSLLSSISNEVSDIRLTLPEGLQHRCSATVGDLLASIDERSVARGGAAVAIIAVQCLPRSRC
jgi:hypothetical protein